MKCIWIFYSKVWASFHWGQWVTEDTFITFEYKIGCLIGIRAFGIFLAWSVWAKVCCYVGKNTVISSVSVDRQLRYRIYIQTKLQKTRYKAKGYTGSYFTVVKVSSLLYSHYMYIRHHCQQARLWSWWYFDWFEVKSMLSPLVSI